MLRIAAEVVAPPRSSALCQRKFAEMIQSSSESTGIGMPTTAKAMELARALLQSMEGSPLSEAVEPSGSWQSIEIAAA